MKLRIFKTMWRKLVQTPSAETVSEPAEMDVPKPTAPAKPDAQKALTNRHGLPVLPPHQDLEALFKDPQPAPQETALNRRPPKKRRCAPRAAPSPPKLKSGIPLLSNDTDFYQLFGADQPLRPSQTGPEPTPSPQQRAESAAAFQKMLEASFEDESLNAMLETKRRSDIPRPIHEDPLRSYPGIEARLDLHGQTATEAHRQVLGFLHMATVDNLLTVKIIVGKGLHSETGPVLRDMVEDLLLALKRQRKVFAFKWEQRRKRKSGAVVVYLPRN